MTTPKITQQTTQPKNTVKFWRLHKKLAYIAGITAILWSLSGILHPILNFVRDTPVTFRPPITDSVDDAGMLVPPSQLSITAPVHAVKRTSINAKPVYQVTFTTPQARQYFDAVTGKQLLNTDKQQAIALAKHYTGREDVVNATLITQFSLAYPAINTFLPAWSVRFAGDAGLTAVVETGRGQLVRLTSDNKQQVLKAFQLIHTVPFLPEILRVPLLSVLILSVFAMACFGIVLLLRWPKKRGRLYRIHRMLAWIVLLPTLAYPISGLFHLWVYAGEEPAAMALPKISLARLTAPPVAPATTVIVNDSVYWRGQQGSNPAVWYDAAAKPLAITDADISQQLTDSNAEPFLTTGFTEEYGFANRILPVWRVEDHHHVHFADVASGQIITSINNVDTIELWSFNHLHKWKFANEWLGKIAGNRMLGMALRDGLQIFLTSLIAVLALVGLLLRRRRIST